VFDTEELITGLNDRIDLVQTRNADEGTEFSDWEPLFGFFAFSNLTRDGLTISLRASHSHDEMDLSGIQVSLLNPSDHQILARENLRPRDGIQSKWWVAYFPLRDYGLTDPPVVVFS
jgi:hypothetical protein